MGELEGPLADLGPVQLRPVRPDDDEAVVRCLAAAFAGTSAPPLSLAAWRWKFLANPAGAGMQMLAVHPDEGVVGVYAGMPLRVSHRGRRGRAAQAVEQCVLPRWLRHGGPHGLFPPLGRAFLARWLGDGDDQVPFVYGLPAASWRSGARHLGWQIARDLDITLREIGAGDAPRATPPELEVRTVQRFGADADALFAHIEPTLGLATVRDQRWFDWRYVDRPDRDYLLLECRERAGGALRGLCVFGSGDVDIANAAYVMDWLAPADDDAATTAMLAALEACARAARRSVLLSVWNHLDARFVAMQRHGHQVRGTPRFLAVVSERHDVLWFREHWYFTLGDCDLA